MLSTMILPLSLYFTLGLAALAALTLMILNIGKGIETCPQNGAAARVLARTTATGFAAIGAGGVVLTGAILPMAPQIMPVTLPLAVGFCLLCLGLGFLRAMESLRANLPDPATGAAPALG